MAQNDTTIVIKDKKKKRKSSSKRSDDGKGKKKKRGCVFYGCLTVTVLSTLFVLLGGFLLWLIISSGPDDLGAINLSQQQIEDVKRRIDIFEQALDEGKRMEIALTGDDLNAVLRIYPEFEKYKDYIRLSIKNDDIWGKVSFPPNLFPVLDPYIPEGLFLNGKAKFKVYVEGGVFHVHMQQLNLRGLNMPEQVMNEIRRENLAKPLEMDDSRTNRVRSIKSIKTRNGKLYAESWGRRQAVRQQAGGGRK